LENLVTAKANSAVTDRMTEFDSFKSMEADVKNLQASVSLLEKSEVSRSQAFTQQIRGL